MKGSVLRALAVAAVLVSVVGSVVPSRAATGTGDAQALAERKAAGLDILHAKVEKALATAAQDASYAQLLAAGDDAHAGVRARVDEVSLVVHGRFEAEEMCLLTPHGEELLRIVGPKLVQERSRREASEPFFTPGLELAPRAVHVSAPYLSPDARKWVLAYVTPITADGRTLGILHFEHSLKTYQDIVRAGVVATDTRVVAVDQNGWVVAEVDTAIPIHARAGIDRPQDYFRRFSFAGADLQMVLEAAREGRSLTGDDSRSYHVGHATSRGWTVLVISPRS